MFQSLFDSIRRFHPLWRLRRSRFFRKLFEIMDFPVAVRIHGLKTKAYVYWIRNASAYTKGDVTEPSVIRVLDALLAMRKTHSFWDLGANIGFYSWYVSEKRPGSKVVMFEPDLENLRLLKKSVKLRPGQDLVIEERAASDTTGFVEFRVDKVSGITGTISTELTTDHERLYGSQESEFRKVAAIRLDDITGHTAPNLMKIDVEGAECFVLKGAHGMIRRQSPVIIIEITDENVGGVLGHCRELGYHLIKLTDQARSGVCDYLMVSRGDEASLGVVRGVGVPLEFLD